MINIFSHNIFTRYIALLGITLALSAARLPALATTITCSMHHSQQLTNNHLVLITVNNYWLSRWY